MFKYKLSIGSMFKNESHSIREWIRHYLLHGVEHFYLINDNSTDNFMEQIKEYVDLNIITLFNVDEPYYLGRQRNLYNKHILPIAKETQWLLMVDLDEYVWSKLDVNLVNVLKIKLMLTLLTIHTYYKKYNFRFFDNDYYNKNIKIMNSITIKKTTHFIA